VDFDYTDPSGSTTARRVEPHRQVHQHLRWYLLAWDTDKQDWRTFRTDRITNPRRRTRTFTPRPLPADTAVDYLRQGLNRQRQRVVLTIDAPMTAVADAFKHEDITLTPVTRSKTRAVLMLDTWQWLLPPLAFLDADFTIHEPTTFRTACRQFATRLTTNE